MKTNLNSKYRPAASTHRKHDRINSPFSGHRGCFFLILVALSLAAQAQQQQSYSQYLFNRYLINPAACASNGYTTIGLLAKKQWLGFTGAPHNEGLSMQMRLARRGGLFTADNGGSNAAPAGIGISLFNDSRGAIRTTGGQLTYAYHIETMSGQLSFGLGVNMFQLYIDRNQLHTEVDDSYLNSARLNTLVPDAVFGVQYSTMDMYVGLSVQNLLQSYLMLGGRNSSGYRIERQYNLMGGYIFMLDESWGLSPGTMFKFTDNFAMQLDAHLQLYYNDKVWAGASYRTGGGGVPGGINLMAGYGFGRFSVCYAYEHSLSNISHYSYGSHELMMTVALGQKKRARYRDRYKFRETDAKSFLRRYKSRTECVHLWY